MRFTVLVSYEFADCVSARACMHSPIAAREKEKERNNERKEREHNDSEIPHGKKVSCDNKNLCVVAKFCL